MKVFRAEKLKIKNSRMRLYSMAIPVLCGGFSLLFGGSRNILHQSIYWWAGVFLPALLQILAYRNISVEKKSNDFFHLKTSAVNTGRVYLAKIFWTLYYGFAGSAWMILLILFFKWSMPHSGSINSSMQIVSGTLTVYLASLWILPLFFLLSEKMKPLLLILFHFLISFLISPFVAKSKFFLFLPHCYAFKPAKLFFLVKESGDILNRPVMKTDRAEMTLALSLSLILFLIFSFLLYRRESENVRQV